MDNEQTIELIEKTLDKIRPFLQRDGGDISFDSFEDGIVYINVLGACEGCALVSQDIEEGIEIIIMEEVPGVIAVRLASEKELIKANLKNLNLDAPSPENN